MEEVEKEDSLSKEPGISSFPQWQSYKQMGELEAIGVRHNDSCNSQQEQGKVLDIEDLVVIRLTNG